jgi:SSS family solute:Na+ symporter
VQRVLGAKDENHGRVGALFCGFIKILPVFIFVLPGLFAYTLFKTGQLDLTSLGVDVAGNVNSKGIYTLMITQLLPSGLIGVLVAALLSGLMSQISGALNSISTMVSYDIYKQKRPHATDKQLITAGKISAVVAMAFSLALLPLLDKYESIFNGINDVIAHIAPPITCVFLLGIFWKKASATSSKWTLWIGSVLGVIVFIANKLLPGTWIGQVPFMVMAFYLFIICVLIQIIFSYRFPVQHTAESKVLYWKNPLEPLKGEVWKGIGNYRVLSGLLLLIVVVLYGIFK